MVWQGFLTESKKYMNHPDYWKEWDMYPYKPDGWTQKDKCKSAFMFWAGFPGAFVRFYFYCFRDWLRKRLI